MSDNDACRLDAIIGIGNRNGVISGNQIACRGDCLGGRGVPAIRIRYDTAGCRYGSTTVISAVAGHVHAEDSRTECGRLGDIHRGCLDAVIGIRYRYGVTSGNQTGCRSRRLNGCRIPAIRVRGCSAGCRYRRCSGVATITKNIGFRSSCCQCSRLSDNDACRLDAIIGIGNRNGIISENQIACRGGCLSWCRIPAIRIRGRSAAGCYRRCSGISTIAKNIGFRSSCCQCSRLSDNDTCRLDAIIGIGNRNSVISENQIACRGGCLGGCRIPAICIRCDTAGCRYRRRSGVSAVTKHIGFRCRRSQSVRLRNDYGCGLGAVMGIRYRDGVGSGNQACDGSRRLYGRGVPAISIRCCSAARRCSCRPAISTVTKNIRFYGGCSQSSGLRNGYVCRLNAVISIRYGNGIAASDKVACRGR